VFISDEEYYEVDDLQEIHDSIVNNDIEQVNMNISCNYIPIDYIPVHELPIWYLLAYLFVSLFVCQSFL